VPRQNTCTLIQLNLFLVLLFLLTLVSLVTLLANFAHLLFIITAHLALLLFTFCSLAPLNAGFSANQISTGVLIQTLVERVTRAVLLAKVLTYLIV
jgi:hypothetical protein